MKCDILTDNGRCGKRDKRYKCKPSTIEWFNDVDEMNLCEIDQVCRNTSIFGNYYFKITNEHIEQLRKGKVIYHRDEYGMFIVLEMESEK